MTEVIFFKYSVPRTYKKEHFLLILWEQCYDNMEARTSITRKLQADISSEYRYKNFQQNTVKLSIATY